MGNKGSSMLQDEEIVYISEETGFSPTQIERLYLRFQSLDSGECGSLSRQDFIKVPELAINPLCDRIVHMFFADCDEDHERINFRQFMKVLATFNSSSKQTKSRQVSRQETAETIETILSPLTQDGFRHSRHSSCDNFFNYHPTNNHHHHHTTNQHSFHYASSSPHSNSALNGHHHHIHEHFHPSNNNLSQLHLHQNGISTAAGAHLKKPFQLPLVDPEEPLNSRKQKLHFMFKLYDVNDDNRLDLDDIISIFKMMVGKYVDDVRVRRIAERCFREADKNCDGYVDFDEFCTTFTRKDIDEVLRVKFSSLN